ncbi:TetR/AcrR family transcriptional regulator [Anditalea andensis]|uniref:TetR family transcriptional regulator n=1 Tax=Anditalea andensis TaxID=1048983 RepID=A0A074KS38_9BACT|nr:TetR/AcrR family transcriptional regulator [Anditalea andensis]KEO71704.1 hypothetical protein EL17_23170 [Anditalea andensis]
MDKNDIKSKLMAAVGQILETEGHCRINADHIAEVAGVNVEDISTSFGDLENLLELYMVSEDYWIKLVRPIYEVVSGNGKLKLEDLIGFFLKKQYNNLSGSAAMRSLIRWGIAEKHPLMGKIGKEREKAGEEVFLQTDRLFEGTGVNFRAISALNVAAIYYLALYGSTGNSKFCGIDLATEEGKKEILNSIKQINRWVFDSIGHRK